MSGERGTDRRQQGRFAAASAYVTPKDLGRLLADRRTQEKLSLEQVARSTGVSAATLSRWERRRAEQRMDADPHKLWAVAGWLGVRLDPAVVPIPLSLSDPVPHCEDQATMDFIEAH